MLLQILSHTLQILSQAYLYELCDPPPIWGGIHIDLEWNCWITYALPFSRTKWWLLKTNPLKPHFVLGMILSQGSTPSVTWEPPLLRAAWPDLHGSPLPPSGTLSMASRTVHAWFSPLSLVRTSQFLPACSFLWPLKLWSIPVAQFLGLFTKLCSFSFSTLNETFRYVFPACIYTCNSRFEFPIKLENFFPTSQLLHYCYFSFSANDSARSSPQLQKPSIAIIYLR